MDRFSLRTGMMIAAGAVSVVTSLSAVGCSGDDDSSGSTPAPDSGSLSADASTGTSCGSSATLCSGACVQTSVDPKNCGACGKACNAGDYCVGGQCTATCAAGNVVCGTECLDPKTSNQHCGATVGCGTSGGNAGTACADGQVCAGGTCALSCQAGYVKCGGKCIDPLTSNQYCGATAACESAAPDAGADAGAGTACAAGQVCSAGACKASCQAGLVECGGTCFDPKTNATHCGATAGCGADGGSAGTVCAAQQACVNGACYGLDSVLFVQKSGAGAADGKVVSNVGGIDCGSTCDAFVPAGSITLTASVTNGATFLGWSGGGCTGVGDCTITMGTSPTTITAAFANTAATLGTNGADQNGSEQAFVVPAGVTKARIEADGAAGCFNAFGGAQMIGTFDVTPGETLKVRVGQTAYNYAGGGGTYVVRGNTLLVAAGGAGCKGVDSDIAEDEVQGRIVISGGTSGAVTRATDGNGGNVIAAGSNSGAGGGWLTDGTGANGKGLGYPNGSTGGSGEGNSSRGGYGGGGARTGLWGQGAGGGYSGGSCGDDPNAMTWHGCGGGGSYSIGTEQNNTAGANVAAGKVVFTY